MDFRGVLLLCAVASGALLGVITTSCSGPDPGQVTFIERPRGTGVDLSSGGTSGTITEAGTDEAGTGTDGGVEGGPTGDPVFGTTAFPGGAVLGRAAPAKAADPAHNNDASGKDCLPCHTGSWTFGGTLYTDAAGTARVAGAEIRITGPDGKEFAKTLSDVDGNFWTDLPAGGVIPVGSRVGVRNGTKIKNMSGTIAAGQAGCSQGATCHGGSAGKVYLTP